MRPVGEITQIQRQPGCIAAGKEARRIQLGNHRRGHHHFLVAAAKIIGGPRLRHHPQLAVEIANRQRHNPFTTLIQDHRLRLLGNNRDVVNRRFTAAFEFIAVAAETQAGETPLPFNHLTVDIINIRAVTLLTKESLPRIRSGVIGDIQHAAVHSGEQHIDLFWHLPLRHAGFDFHRQRLIRAYFFWCIQRKRQAAVFIAQRQVQQTHRPFWRRRAGFIPGANHQGAEVEIVTVPGFIDRNR